MRLTAKESLAFQATAAQLHRDCLREERLAATGRREVGASARAPTLTEQLAVLGYTHEPAPNAASTGRHRILRPGGEVFTGRAGETWAWLRETGQIAQEKR